MKLAQFFISAVFVIAISEHAMSACEGYNIEGKDSFGHYQAQVQISDKTSPVIILDYFKKWNGYSIQGLHRGRLTAGTNDQLVVDFELKRHQFITKLNDIALTKSEFQSSYLIRFHLNKSEVTTCRTISDQDDKREKIEIKKSVENPFLVQVADKLLISGVKKWYLKQPELDPYRQSEDFIHKKFYYVNDFTDLKFYRSHPNFLRFRNIEVNDFTLREVALRNTAYANSITEKADYFENSTFQNNINTLGMFDYTINDERHSDYDSALWTAMYAASQAMRYNVTKNSEALQRFKNSIQALVTLVDITEDQQSFARALMPVHTTTRINDQWKKGSGQYENVYWLPGGNNDMIKGLFLGFIWAYKTLDHRDPLFLKVKKAVRQLENIKLKRLSQINQVYIQGLNALFYLDQQNYKKFIHFYLSNQNIVDLLGVDRPFFVDGIADWSGVHLSMVAHLSLLLITEEIQKKENHFRSAYSELDMIDRSTVNAAWIIEQIKETLNDSYVAMKNTKRDYLCLMNYSINRSLMKSSIEQCFASFIETPMVLPLDGLEMDRRYNKDFIYSPTPDLPWKAVFERKSVDKFLGANTHFPKFEGDGIDSQYMWKDNAFEILGRKQSGKLMPRIDYLFSYWALRYYVGSDRNFVENIDKF